jgi:hypothetical protein
MKKETFSLKGCGGAYNMEATVPVSVSSEHYCKKHDSSDPSNMTWIEHHDFAYKQSFFCKYANVQCNHLMICKSSQLAE